MEGDAANLPRRKRIPELTIYSGVAAFHRQRHREHKETQDS